MNRSVDILNELNEISPLVASIGKINVFTVPQHYFDTVATTVMLCLQEDDDAVAESKDVPTGYFDDLSKNILSKIQGTAANELQDISPVLAGIKKEHPFKTPGYYFEQLPADIISKLADDEVAGILPDVKSLQPFTVPQGYFDNLSRDILSKIQSEQGARLVTMPKRRRFILKYAVAAMLTGAVALGVYKIANTTAVLAPVIEQGIAIAADDSKFNETLNNLNEEDIAKYLEKNGSEADMAVLTSGLDESELPDQDEYLTDEKTLENFIETISSKN